MFLCLLFVALLPLSLIGCSNDAYASKTFFAMDTVMSVSYAGDGALFPEIESLIQNLEKKVSVTDETSFIYALNRRGERVTDEECVSLIRRCAELSALTNGAFDATVYPLVRSWGFTTGQNRVPSDEEISSLLPLVGYEKIDLSDGVTLPTGTEIDLGAIAKGYLSDVLISYLKNAGVTSAVLNLGGNVYALGKKQSGSLWRVAVSSPDSDGYVGTLEVSDLAVITSGIYERYFEQDGVRYGHIIDPFTGKPVDGDLLSVTVVGENGATCDALSTALFVMGKDKAISFAKQHDLSVILVDTARKTYVSESLSSSFRQDDAFRAYGLEVIA